MLKLKWSGYVFPPYSAILITCWNCYTSLVLKLKYSKLLFVIVNHEMYNTFMIFVIVNHVMYNIFMIFINVNHVMYNRLIICVIVNHEYIIHYRKHGRRKKVAQVNMTNDLEQLYNILKSKRRKRNNTGIF
jgi:hypothetical protein